MEVRNLFVSFRVDSISIVSDLAIYANAKLNVDEFAPMYRKSPPTFPSLDTHSGKMESERATTARLLHLALAREGKPQGVSELN